MNLSTITLTCSMSIAPSTDGRRRANSFHCYTKDYDMLNSYVARINAGGDATYFYKGDWDEQMEEAKPEIAEMVARLKGENHA